MNGRLKKRESRLINFYLPDIMLPVLDKGVRKIDSDRSKFIRIAIREKLIRHGIREARVVSEI